MRGRDHRGCVVFDRLLEQVRQSVKGCLAVLPLQLLLKTWQNQQVGHAASLLKLGSSCSLPAAGLGPALSTRVHIHDDATAHPPLYKGR